MLIRCEHCGEIEEGVSNMENVQKCHYCYWNEFDNKELPTIKGPTIEDFSLNFDRDPELDNTIRISNALEVIDSYQGIAGTQSGGNVDALVFSALDVHYMLNEIIEALEDDLC